MRKVFAIATLVATLAFTGCTQSKEPAVEEEELTVRERAQRVGKFSDRTLTSGMEESLVDIVDKAAQRADELEEAAGE